VWAREKWASGKERLKSKLEKESAIFRGVDRSSGGLVKELRFSLLEQMKQL